MMVGEEGGKQEREAREKVGFITHTDFLCSKIHFTFHLSMHIYHIYDRGDLGGVGGGGD